MQKKSIAANAFRIFALFLLFGAAQSMRAQDAATPYATMAPLSQYLMDRSAEIALARSAAPQAISQNAEVLVLGPHGFETAVKGSNGWVCMVERGWGSIFDWPEYWNPKIRAAACLNPAAARSMRPLAYKRTELVLAGRSKLEIIAALKAAYAKKQLPTVEPGALSYMMAKDAYLTDGGGHNLPHVMFYAPTTDVAAWGANLPDSPMMGVNFWYISAASFPGLQSLPPLAVLMVPVSKWSDGTPAPAM